MAAVGAQNQLPDDDVAAGTARLVAARVAGDATAALSAPSAPVEGSAGSGRRRRTGRRHVEDDVVELYPIRKKAHTQDFFEQALSSPSAPVAPSAPVEGSARNERRRGAKRPREEDTVAFYPIQKKALTQKIFASASKRRDPVEGAVRRPHHVFFRGRR